MEWLENNHFITSMTDEIGFIIKEYEQYRTRPRNPAFRILTTFGCNADCDYCFEKKDSHNKMTTEIVF